MQIEIFFFFLFIGFFQSWRVIEAPGQEGKKRKLLTPSIIHQQVEGRHGSHTDDQTSDSTEMMSLTHSEKFEKI
jgi:N-acetylglucosamine-6-phosphate deacetylase